MAKLTNAQLISRVALLESEILRLKDEKAQENKLAKETTGCDTWALAYHKVAQELINLKGEKTETKTESPNIVKVAEEKTLATMRWLLKYVDFKTSCTDEFLMGFDIWTNGEKNRLAIMPKKGTKTNGFIRELNQSRHSRNIQGNYWKNDGMWCNIPVKK